MSDKLIIFQDSNVYFDTFKFKAVIFNNIYAIKIPEIITFLFMTLRDI